MVPTRHAFAMLVTAMAAAIVTPAKAEVLDAIYRGTMVCNKMPFTEMNMREAIRVTISGGKVSYTHVVRLRDTPEGTAEQGAGTLDGQNISLEGTWKGGSREYRASYSGVFVRRSAKLRGTQTWTDGARTITRTCSGVIKRPLKPFLPRNKKT